MNSITFCRIKENRLFLNILKMFSVFESLENNYIRQNQIEQNLISCVTEPILEPYNELMPLDGGELNNHSSAYSQMYSSISNDSCFEIYSNACYNSYSNLQNQQNKFLDFKCSTYCDNYILMGGQDALNYAFESYNPISGALITNYRFTGYSGAETKDLNFADYSEIETLNRNLAEYSGIEAANRDFAEYSGIETVNRNIAEYSGIGTVNRNFADYSGVETVNRDFADCSNIETANHNIAEYSSVGTVNRNFADYSGVETVNRDFADYSGIETVNRDFAEYSGIETINRNIAEYSGIETINRNIADYSEIETVNSILHFPTLGDNQQHFKACCSSDCILSTDFSRRIFGTANSQENMQQVFISERLTDRLVSISSLIYCNADLMKTSGYFPQNTPCDYSEYFRAAALTNMNLNAEKRTLPIFCSAVLNLDLISDFNALFGKAISRNRLNAELDFSAIDLNESAYYQSLIPKSENLALIKSDNIKPALFQPLLKNQFPIFELLQSEYNNLLNPNKIEGLPCFTVENAHTLSPEEITLLREIIIEPCYQGREKTEIKVDMTGMKNIINEKTDVTDLIADLTQAVGEAVSAAAEGVHY